MKSEETKAFVNRHFERNFLPEFLVFILNEQKYSVTQVFLEAYYIEILHKPSIPLYQIPYPLTFKFCISHYGNILRNGTNAESN
jgi:hypothetical protein